MIRGVRAVKVLSSPLPAATSSLVPCYIGMAPYWHTGTGWAAKAGQAFICNSFEEFKAQIGYYEPASGRWPQHVSLCEAAAAHFKRAASPVGPIICVVNALTLSTAAATPATIAFVGGIANLDVSGLAILSTAAITGKTLGTDYTVAYDEAGRKLVFTDLTGELVSETATYNVVVIPQTLTMSETTMDVLDTMDQDISRHPAVVAAPGWESGAIGTGTVGAAIQALANNKIGGHWYVQAYVQLSSDAYASVAGEKMSAAYSSPQLRACWPYTCRDGLVYSLVTRLLVAKMLTDIARGGVPCESASNKIADIDFPCEDDGTKIKLTESQADALNGIGITTIKWIAGSWRTWGNKMSNYLSASAESILPEHLNDVAVQMLDYICNDFQERNLALIDAPMSRRVARAVVDDYQVVLNMLNAIEGIMYGRIYLDPTKNTTRELVAGDLTYGLVVTPTPPINSLTGEVQYTAQGLGAITEGGVV